jgi:hypothetical protein
VLRVSKRKSQNREVMIEIEIAQQLLHGNGDHFVNQCTCETHGAREATQKPRVPFDLPVARLVHSKRAFGTFPTPYLSSKPYGRGGLHADYHSAYLHGWLELMLKD